MAKEIFIKLFYRDFGVGSSSAQEEDAENSIVEKSLADSRTIRRTSSSEHQNIKNKDLLRTFWKV